ncbi:MAG: alpha/beta hydrolase, partial [Pseudomonadota bacterium]
IARANEPAPAAEEARYWYIYFFHTERGRQALETDRTAFCRYIWNLWSPNWNFDDATYARSAAAFENPDFVDIVIHSYRHRFGGITGDPAVAQIEAQLATQPDITVPTIILQGTDDTVDPPPAEDDVRHHFTGPYERIIMKGVGHNPPQETPDAFAEAVMKVVP